MKTAIAVSKSVGKKVVIGMSLCTRCAAIPLDDEVAFYDYMTAEHRLAKADEEGEAAWGGDESMMDTDMNPDVERPKPKINYMEFSEDEDEDPGLTLSQGSEYSQGTDYKNDYYRQQAEMSLQIIRQTFPDLNLPKTSFDLQNNLSGSYKWTIRS